MLLEIGKVDKATFDRVIFPHLGKADPSVLLGPKHSVDAGVIELMKQYCVEKGFLFGLIDRTVEPLSVALGNTAVGVADIAIDIARRYKKKLG